MRLCLRCCVFVDPVDVGAGKHRVECGGQRGHPRRGNPLILQGFTPAAEPGPAAPASTAEITAGGLLAYRWWPAAATTIADVLSATGSAVCTVSVPAKLNVGLAVGPRQPDGFHPI